MTMLLVCEYRQGLLPDTASELAAFAAHLHASASWCAPGGGGELLQFGGTVYVPDADGASEYDPDGHGRLIAEAARRAGADTIVFSHSAYGWDMAPRVAASLKWALITDIVAAADGAYEVPCFNAKMRRRVRPTTEGAVLTIQAGAFTGAAVQGAPTIERLALPEAPIEKSAEEFAGYEAGQAKDLDLARADVIVSVGRGIGKKENISVIEALAGALGGKLGATRPIVDAGWLPYSHQVGSTGQIVSPKLYVACGISGAIQHLAGMKRSNFIAAINKDKDAPIGDVADVFVVADVMEFVPALTARLRK
ncbi:MAG: electron transfer flavoprotein subunit alpha/FixB family protein [Acidobacteriota bacterium]